MNKQQLIMALGISSVSAIWSVVRSTGAVSADGAAVGMNGLGDFCFLGSSAIVSQREICRGMYLMNGS